MGKSWTDDLAGKVILVLVLASSLADSWGSWWVVLPGAIALGWGVLLVRDAGKAVRRRRRGKGTVRTVRTRYLETAAPHDMGIVVGELIPVLLSVRAKVLIDLHADEPIDDERAGAAFEAAKQHARRASGPEGARGPDRRTDPFMGVEVDLTDPDQAARYALLAHRVIGSEAWCGDHQVFGTVESPVRVWVDLADEAVDRAVDAARSAGASVTVRT
ncbi:hypothetical protein AB0467_13585 [Streptomyces sp. NPDC052095]|uniref:hypothetical protein n=1 Tax=unclassified Streptomyces TaxID=2593676 RepID=UPI00344B7A92